MNLVTTALSVRQPWSELILSGRKTLELRAWDTEYRGPLWIHAGKHEDPELDRQFGLRDLPRGAFLGLVEISGTTQLNAERWERLRKYHLSGENFQVGVFAWTLANPRRLIEPILAPGSLRLFQVDKQLSQRLTSMLE